MRRLFLLTVMFLFCILMGCGQSYRWSKSHPDYSKAPYGELAVAGVQSAFVLTRTAWFANRIDIPNDSIQLKVTAICAQDMLDELKKGYAKLTILPDSITSRLPEESEKIDERIFLKGKFPEQGVMVKDSAGNVPKVILLVHEIIVGTDLKREDYFDYSLMQNEAQEKKLVENITAIVSYTLWDNEKQRPLFSAIDEIQHPVKVLSMEDIHSLVREIVESIRRNLYTGAKS